MKKITWVKEKEAADMLGRRPRTLRALVQTRKLPVNFTHINGRTYMYSKEDIEKMLIQNSTIV